MIKHFNVNIDEKESNHINKNTYLELKCTESEKDFAEKVKSRIEYNYDLNMKYFSDLDYDEFNNYVAKFVEKNKFEEVFDLNEYNNVSGIYIMVLDKYKQVYIGISNAGIKKRICQHWKVKKSYDRLIWGKAYNSVLSIDSFGALDTTRIFVRTKGNVFDLENKYVEKFDNRYILNRTCGGIGSEITNTNDTVSALLAAVKNAKQRNFEKYIDKNELLDKCGEYDYDSYVSKK